MTDTTTKTFDDMAEQLRSMGETPAFNESSHAKQSTCCGCGKGCQSTQARTAEYAKRFQALGTQMQTLAQDFVNVATQHVRAGAQSILDATDPNKASKDSADSNKDKDATI